jgi:RNA polymerase sigma factor (sigma-70 family)
MTAARWAAAGWRQFVQRDLVERAQVGDHRAFEALATAAARRLDTAARLILRDPDRAKDAVQDTLVLAWRDVPKLRDPDRWEAWLHRILVHACLADLRRNRRGPTMVELSSIDMPTAIDQASGVVTRDEIERGFRRLDDELRVVVVLHYYLDLPLAEVAERIGVPVGTAKSRLNRALVAMRRHLGAADRLEAEPIVQEAWR